MNISTSTARSRRSRPTGCSPPASQHEIDHLNGVLFIDHISQLKRDLRHQEIRQGGEARRRPDRHSALIFMGTPDFAVPTLLRDRRARPRGRCGLYARAEAGRPRHGAAAVAGRARGAALRPAGADARRRCERRRRQAAFRAHGADAAVVVAYGLILPKPFSMRCRSAASTCTPRCCRAGAARRRSTAPSWRATPRPASW